MKNAENRVFARGMPAFCEHAISQRVFVVFFQRWAHGVPMMSRGRRQAACPLPRMATLWQWAWTSWSVGAAASWARPCGPGAWCLPTAIGNALFERKSLDGPFVKAIRLSSVPDGQRPALWENFLGQW